MLERVLRPDAGHEPRRPVVPPRHAGVSNHALSRALLQRDWRKYKGERTLQTLQNDKEKEIYASLRNAGFAEEEIATAGPGKPNADLLAYDGNRLWIVEVKGHNDWLSKGNQTESHNVPLKQLGQKLMGARRKTLKVAKATISVEDFLATPNAEGRDAITLMVTNLDTEGALLAVEMITGKEGERPEASYYATTLHQVMRFIQDALDGDYAEGADEDAAAMIDEYSATAQELLGDWEEWEGTPEVFLSNNAVTIETVYTRFRQAAAHSQPHATFARLDAELNVNVALVPVRQSLPRAARRAVLARTAFKSVQEARAWLENEAKTSPREKDEDDDGWIVRLLSGSPEYSGNDFMVNYELLHKALAPVAEPQPQPQLQAPQREPPKGKKQRTVEPDIWNHIVNGVIVVDKVGQQKKPVERVAGLHTTRGNRPVGEGYGEKKMVGEHGCYKQSVRPRNPQYPDTQDKKFQSTFFPDDWTLEDIREAIEYAAPPRNSVFEVLTPKKGIGMTLWFNGESYYPNYR